LRQSKRQEARGNTLANWKADKGGDTWTVPLGLVCKGNLFDK